LQSDVEGGWESLTLKAQLTTADEHGCGLIARRTGLGKMASF
jgi:hypothetical protein